jgi:large subunit ribosomal protein L17
MALLFRRIKDKKRHMLRSMASSLIIHGKVTSTTARIKELKPIVEKWVTAGRKTARATGSAKLALYRSLVSEVHQISTIKKLIEEVVPRIGDRKGGYTRIYKLGNRHGDAAPQSMITFVDKPTPTVADKSTDAKKIATKKVIKPTSNVQEKARV